MTKFLFTLLLCSLGCFSLSAEITILDSSHSDTGGVCNGTITVRATGSAGPFTISYYDHANGAAVELIDVKGDIVLDGLCNTYHVINVYPTRFPGCAKNLQVDLQLVIFSGKTSDKLEGLVEGELNISVSPNPTSGQVEVMATGLPLEENYKGGDWSVDILDATGKTYQQESISAGEDKLSRKFPLNLKGLTKGIYFIRVIRSDGAEGMGKVILQ